MLLLVALLLILQLGAFHQSAYADPVEQAFTYYGQGYYKEAVREILDHQEANDEDPRANLAAGLLLFNVARKDSRTLYEYFGTWDFYWIIGSYFNRAHFFDKPGGKIGAEARYWSCRIEDAVGRHAQAARCIIRDIFEPYGKREDLKDLIIRSILFYAEQAHKLREYDVSFKWYEYAIDKYDLNEEYFRQALVGMAESNRRIKDMNIAEQRYRDLMQRHGHHIIEERDEGPVSYEEWLLLELAEYYLDRRERLLAKQVINEYREKYPRGALLSRADTIEKRI